MYIVTDLTRFRVGNPDVCTALIDMETGACVRPLPHFTYDLMRTHSVLPGAKFTGTFTPTADCAAPHVEDCIYSNLKHIGPASRDEFRSILQRTAWPSVAEGFQYALNGQKVVPIAHKSPRSIITVQVDPGRVTIARDQYNDGKIKIFFSDSSGTQYTFIAITDLGFFDYASRNRSADGLMRINRHIAGSQEVFLRIGLSRPHAVGERNGYWIQVNGIYTFPQKLGLVRGYE